MSEIELSNRKCALCDGTGTVHMHLPVAFSGGELPDCTDEQFWDAVADLRRFLSEKLTPLQPSKSETPHETRDDSTDELLPAPPQNKGMSSKERTVFYYVNNVPGKTTDEILTGIGGKKRHLKKALVSLLERGLIVEEKTRIYITKSDTGAPEERHEL